MGNNLVQVFDSAGKFLFSFGGKGSGTGQVDNVRSAAFGLDGTIAVGEWNNNRIEVFR